jgi:hypothetical protein
VAPGIRASLVVKVRITMRRGCKANARAAGEWIVGAFR